MQLSLFARRTMTRAALGSLIVRVRLLRYHIDYNEIVLVYLIR